MKLRELPFDQIKSKVKIWEVRLNDEKRKNINIGDSILFRKLPDLFDGVVCRVVDKKYFTSFREMATVLSLKSLGLEESATVDDCENLYHTYYTPEEEQQLLDDEYQNKLAWGIFNGIIEYFNE